MTTRNDQRGVAHVLLVVLVVVVVAVIGFAGYKVIGNKDSDAANTATEQAIRQATKADCAKLNDDDLCKFFTSWQSHKRYKMVSTSAGSSFTIEVDGDNSHMTATGETTYETISIGKDHYVKAGSDWYKQTLKEETSSSAVQSQIDFQAPAEDDGADNAADKTVYKKLGKEACGNLQCFKYEIVDPASTDSKQIVWFDDKDYQARKYRTESADGVSEMTFEYGNVSVKAPSPVKTLEANQYIVPGQAEPMTLPDGVDPTGGI